MYLVQGEKMRCVKERLVVALFPCGVHQDRGWWGDVSVAFLTKSLIYEYMSLAERRCPPRQVKVGLCKRKFAEEKETTCEGKMFPSQSLTLDSSIPTKLPPSRA